VSILVIDNYDSFTYNTVQQLGILGAEIQVVRSREKTLAEIIAFKPGAIVISPGPGTPNDSGISLKVLEHFAGLVPCLGICLGHQCLAQLFGGAIVKAELPVHGKTSLISHNRAGVFSGLTSPFRATRYNSLIVERNSLPECLEITAESESGEIMGIRHRDIPMLEGFQFHPESVLSEGGETIFRNFINYLSSNGASSN